MKLKFLGNGSGFSNSHTGAYFEKDEDIIFIDCSMLNILKMVELAKNYGNVYVYMTHLHSDHSSGLGLFAQYMYYTQGKKLNIVVSDALIDDIKTLFEITGVPLDICNIAQPDDKKDKKYKLIPISTTHASELNGKCFRYEIHIDDDILVYTGDTCNINDFLEPMKKCIELYVDVSASYGGVHLKYDDIKNILILLKYNENKKRTKEINTIKLRL